MLRRLLAYLESALPASWSGSTLASVALSLDRLRLQIHSVPWTPPELELSSDPRMIARLQGSVQPRGGLVAFAVGDGDLDLPVVGRRGDVEGSAT